MIKRNKYLAIIFILFLRIQSFTVAQESTVLDSTLGKDSPVKILVLNQGIIGISKMESEVIGEYIKDEIDETFKFKSVSNEQFKESEYDECFDEECLRQLSQTFDIENFLLWSLEKSGNRYSANFTHYVFKQGEEKKSKVKSVKMNLKTENVDEMILAMRMNTWKALGLKPPKGKFDNIIDNTMFRSNRAKGLLALLVLIVGYGIINGDSSTGPDPFENPPDWPSV